MAAYRPLPEDHQGAGQDVGALHGDGHRQGLVGAPEIVGRTHADAAPAMHVHGIVDDLAHRFGQVVLDHGRDHRWPFAGIQGGHGQATATIHQIGQAADTRQRLLHPFEPADGQMELAAYPRIGARGKTGQLAATGAQRRQRYTAPDRKPLDQHAPSIADLCLTADQPRHRDEHVSAAVRAVLEGRARGVVATADVDTRRTRRNQGAGDAQILDLAQQMVRIVGVKGQPQQRGHRAQRDIALVPVDAEAQHLASLEASLAHDAGIRQ